MTQTKILYLPSTLGTIDYFEETRGYLNELIELKEGTNTYETEIFNPKKTRKLKDYKKELEGHIGKDKEHEYILVAHSNVGNPALEIAGEYENVKKLVLIETILDWEDQPAFFKGVTWALNQPRIKKYFEEHEKSGDKLIETMLNTMIDKKEIKDDTYNNLFEITKQLGMENLINALKDMKEYTSSEEDNSFIGILKELIMKGIDVHYFHGSKSKDERKYSNNRLTEAGVKEGNIHEIEKSGHLLTVEKPYEFYEAFAEKVLGIEKREIGRVQKKHKMATPAIPDNTILEKE